MKMRQAVGPKRWRNALLSASLPVAAALVCWAAAATPAGALRQATALAGAMAWPQSAAAAAEAYMLAQMHAQDPFAGEDILPAETVQPSVPAETTPQPTVQAAAVTEAGAPVDAGAQADIPEARRGPIEQSQFYSRITGDTYFDFGSACVRNATDYATADMCAAAQGALGFSVELNSDEPQVLIMHTHSTESYDPRDCGWYDSEYPTRSTDAHSNITAVGAVLCEELNALGINAVHAPEYHDYPSYNNSYSRSAETVKKYLEQYPSVKVVLDIHRDGMQREDGTRVKPTVEVNGEKAAQIMIVSGADDGTMGMPLFRENLKFAVRLGDAVETLYPGLSRPIYLAYRHYNQDLTTGSLLIEVGSEANTLPEAKYTARLVARALAYCFGADVQP